MQVLFYPSLFRKVRDLFDYLIKIHYYIPKFIYKDSQMDTNLKGRVALVTGSSRGLGKAIACKLAEERAEVIINGRNGSDVRNVADEIERKFSVLAHQFTSDVTNPNGIRRFFREEIPRIGRLDILVNNVGNIEKFGSFEDLEDDDWFRSFDLGFMSAVRFIKASLPYLKNSDQARIINIASLSAHQPSGRNPHYSIAKAAMVNLTKSLANDFGKYGITVNTVCPSTLAGGGWHQNIQDRAIRDNISPEEAERLMRQEEIKKSPLGKIGELEDVANQVICLASASAKFSTGHCYNVDGGITRSI